MPLDNIDINAIKTTLRTKLASTNETGLFLTPLITRHSLTEADIEALIKRITEDGDIRCDGSWRTATGKETEVRFIRGIQE